MARIRRLAQLLGFALLGLALLVVVRKLLGGGEATILPAEPALPNDAARPSEPRRSVAAPAVVETTVPWWVAPDDGACPLTHPVKAKASSGIYHVPGGQSYDRTTPDRCYLSTSAAEADGYRAAKR